ncbi:MAG: phosphatidate cytidylyltransferase [Chloroflexota bacterium]|nr:phosphatidate cytidylyltransferase [Chloroflexota bacterium]
MLRQRLLTAAVGIPLLAVVLLLGQPWLAVLLALLVLGAAIELARLMRQAGFESVPVLTAVLALAGAAALAFGDVAGGDVVLSDGRLALAWLALVVVAAASAAIILPIPAAGLRRFAATVSGALALAMLGFLLRIALEAGTESAAGQLVELLDPGRAWLLAVVLAVWAYDSAAYATGRLWGRRRFFAHISPHKTWSGAAGGSGGAIAGALLLGLLLGRPAEGAGLGLVVALVAPVGDLAESMLKRAAGAKDSGGFFPGHGGVLDRVDSFLAVAPAAWLYLEVVGVL